MVNETYEKFYINLFYDYEPLFLQVVPNIVTELNCWLQLKLVPTNEYKKGLHV